LLAKCSATQVTSSVLYFKLVFRWVLSLTFLELALDHDPPASPPEYLGSQAWLPHPMTLAYDSTGYLAHHISVTIVYTLWCLTFFHSMLCQHEYSSIMFCVRVNPSFALLIESHCVTMVKYIQLFYIYRHLGRSQFGAF
jgi:hypothetical protein